MSKWNVHEPYAAHRAGLVYSSVLIISHDIEQLFRVIDLLYVETWTSVVAKIVRKHIIEYC